MKIIFNYMGVGLGNNGGTKTIVRSAETLQKIGHDVYIASDINKFTWFVPKVKVISRIEECDIVIATSCKTVRLTEAWPASKKAYYIRAIETWAQPEVKLLEGYRAGLHNIVNSIWMKRWLADKGIHSDVVYPGLDFDIFYDEAIRGTVPIRIGFLYSKKSRKRWGDCVALIRSIKSNKVEFAAFGIEPSPKVGFLKEYLRNPTEHQLRHFYSKCHIWFAPSNNEGLHICPQEAGLCGCAIAVRDNPWAGNEDYALFGETAVKLGEVRKLIDNEELRDRMVLNLHDRLENHIGSRKTNMKKLVDILSK